MISNVILKTKKNDIAYNNINKFFKVHVYDSGLDYYTMYQIKESLKDISIFFSKQVLLDFLDILDVKFDIKLYSIQLKKYNCEQDYFKDSTLVNIGNLSTFSEIGIIGFSDKIIESIIDVLFGGKNILQDCSNNSYTLKKYDVKIIEKIIDIIKKSYCMSWKKKHGIDIEFSNFRLVEKAHLDSIIPNNSIFLFTIFKIKCGNKLGFLNISLSFSFIKKFKNELLEKHKNKIFFEKKHVDKISLKMIYNLKINLDVKLVGLSLLLSKISFLKIGDIIFINTPENALAFSNNIPVISGKYKMYKNKYVFFVKNFLI
ncbi:MAG: hypothetical protein U0T63_00360 [Buchnera aphidicola (Nurudea shiraii)]